MAIEGYDEMRLVGQRKSAGGKVGGGRLHEEKEALGRSVEKCSVGPQVVSVKWVDTNRGESRKTVPQARDFRGPDKDREDLFAATPPWELRNC